MMETILQLSRRMAHNASPSSMDMKYSPTDSLKLSNRDNKRIERRKPNWTEAENVFLLDQFGLHREILTCKATDASTNLKKQEIWRVICQNLNTHNTLVRRTPAEVRRKWKNLVTAAKKEVWEMRHQIHLTGGGGPNGRKISELSQRVLQLHSSGGFSGGNPNGLYGTLLSAGLIGPPGSGAGGPSSGSGDNNKYSTNKYGDSIDDKSFIPAHFTPIITLSESNNNHIMGGNHSGHSGEGPPSPLSEEDDDESSDSRNATEFMSDSGIYEQEGIDLRVRHTNSVLGLITRGAAEERRQLIMNNDIIKNNNNNNNKNNIIRNNIEEDHDPEDDPEGDEDEGDNMSLIAYSNHHLGRHLNHNNSTPLNNYITNASALAAAGYRGSLGSSLRPFQQPIPGGLLPPSSGGDIEEQRKSSDTTEEMLNINTNPSSGINGHLIDATLKLRNHFIASLKESDLLTNLYKERLELQIEVLKLRKQKLCEELKSRPRGAAINRLIANNFSRIRLAKRRPLFRLKPRNTWLNIQGRNNNNKFTKDTKDIFDKATNTEIMINGNSPLHNIIKE